MALKTIKTNTKDVAPKKSGTDIKTVHIKGQAISRFNAAKAEIARAEADIIEIEPFIKREASREVFAMNVLDKTNDTKSVKLVDETGAGVRVTLSAVYPALAEETVVNLFESIVQKADGSKADVNDYVIQTRKAKFDSKAFLKDGEFCEAHYSAFFKACQTVADKFGIANPMSTEVVVVPKPDFDKKRYSDFDLAAQTRIYEVVPNKTSITSVV
jgi:hypothetical protein